ncbi:MAG: DUF4258 domain-containing protein [Candidatus Kryptoniota bacterium]
MIIFTKHAKEKFVILRKHKFVLNEEQVLETVKNPETVDYSRAPLFIAQRLLDKDHVLRVVCKKEDDDIKIITFYPGRKSQYEKK